MQARKEWQDIFKGVKEKKNKTKKLQPRMLYPARLSFRIGGEIKNFFGEQELKEYSNTKLILKKYLKVSTKEKRNKKT